jgi:hypothetical protein
MSQQGAGCEFAGSQMLRALVMVEADRSSELFAVPIRPRRKEVIKAL